jgi:hypothetical protein
MLMGLLGEPRLAVVALIGLVGVWPEERNSFEDLLSPSAQGGELLSLGTELASSAGDDREGQGRRR